MALFIKTLFLRTLFLGPLCLGALFLMALILGVLHYRENSCTVAALGLFPLLRRFQWFSRNRGEGWRGRRGFLFAPHRANILVVLAAQFAGIDLARARGAAELDQGDEEGRLREVNCRVESRSCQGCRKSEQGGLLQSRCDYLVRKRSHHFLI